MKFKIHKNPFIEQPYHFTIILKNGQVGGISETYNNFGDMLSAIIQIAVDSCIDLYANFYLTEAQLGKVLTHVGHLDVNFHPLPPFACKECGHSEFEVVAIAPHVWKCKSCGHPNDAITQ